MMRSTLLLGLALSLFRVTGAIESADTVDCSKWTLDGYHLGMPGDELLGVRSVTLHVEGQAQAIEPGKFHGVLVLDALSRLEKWDAIYDTRSGEGLRAEMTARFGAPTSDVSGVLWDDGTETARQRRTIWWSTDCDAAIVVYDNTIGRDAQARTVSATLARASVLPPGLAEMKTLFH